MRKQRKLVGPYWFTLFTEFFAILSLLFFAIENQDKPGSAEVLEDAVAGKDMIAGAARQSMAATRISKSLNVSHLQILGTLFHNVDNLVLGALGPDPGKSPPDEGQVWLEEALCASRW